MKQLFLFTTLWAVVVSLHAQPAASVYEVRDGVVEFSSNAPKELIHARSTALRGVLDAGKQTFLFRIAVSTFEGFNSPLQREHFNENYMESRMHPEATYTGKILEALDLRRDGTYNVRTKGRLRVHGVEIERIVPSRVTVRNGRITLESEFTVPLADHRIKIPRVVYDKLSPEIHVTVRASVAPRA